MNENNVEQCVINMIANLLEEPNRGSDIKIEENYSDDSDNNIPYFQKNYVRQNSQKIKTDNFTDQRYIEKVWQPINKSSNNALNSVNNLFEEYDFSVNEFEFRMQQKQEKNWRIKSAEHNQHSRESRPHLILNEAVAVPEQKRSTTNLMKITVTAESKEQAAFDCLKEMVANEKRISKVSFAYLKDHFYAMVTFHNGSRIIQEALFQTEYEYIIEIYHELADHLKDLVIHPYANYFVQKFFERLDRAYRIDFMNKIKDYICSIANHPKGTFFLQKIFDMLDSNTFSESQKIIIDALTPTTLLNLAMNEFGCHVIEKIIEVFDENLIIAIVKELMEKFLQLAYHCHGVCAVKRIVGYIKSPEISEQIFKIVNDNFIQLIQHPSGNYIIQEAIDKWEPGQRRNTLINLFKNNYHSFSMNKCAGSVVEKCFQKEEITIKHFVDEICLKTKLLDLLKNQYGNYVVKKALDCAKGHLKPKLIHNLNKNLQKLTDKKLIEKWKRILEDFPISNFIIDPKTRSSMNQSVDSHSSLYSSGSSEQLSSGSANSKSSLQNEDEHTMQDVKNNSSGNIPGFYHLNESHGSILRNTFPMGKNIPIGNMPCLSPKMEASLVKNKQSDKMNKIIPLGLNVNPPISGNIEVSNDLMIFNSMQSLYNPPMISLNPPMSYNSQFNSMGPYVGIKVNVNESQNIPVNQGGQCNFMVQGNQMMGNINPMYPRGQQGQQGQSNMNLSDLSSKRKKKK